MSESEPTATQGTSDKDQVPKPLLLPVGVISLCMPPVVLYVVCVQVFYGLLSDLVKSNAEYLLIMGNLVVGFLFGVAAYTEAGPNPRPTTILLTFIAMAMNVLALFAGALFYLSAIMAP